MPSAIARGGFRRIILGLGTLETAFIGLQAGICAHLQFPARGHMHGLSGPASDVFDRAVLRRRRGRPGFVGKSRRWHRNGYNGFRRKRTPGCDRQGERLARRAVEKETLSPRGWIAGR
jgi:hypothetical protein